MGGALLGSRVPDTDFGVLEGDKVRPLAARTAFGSGRVLALGVPGAFTPSCSEQHVPDLIRNQARLRSQGFERFVVIAPNDPFVLRAWSASIDPESRLCFLSDGNLDFAGALGMTNRNRALFLGKRTERYLMIAEGGIIRRLRSEPDPILAGGQSRILETAFL